MSTIDRISRGADAAAAAESTSAPPTRRTILVVDDEPNVLRSLRRLLRREPYDLELCESPERALELLTQRTYHLIVSDYSMPGMTGVQLLRAVQERWPETPRIILSGYSEVDAIVEAINEGAICKFLSKPWDEDDVKRHIRHALDVHEFEVRRDRALVRMTDEVQRALERGAISNEAGALDCQPTPVLSEVCGVGIVAVAGADGTVLAANAIASTLLGTSRPQLVGQCLASVVPGPWCSAVESSRELPESGARGEWSGPAGSLCWWLRTHGDLSAGGCHCLVVWPSCEEQEEHNSV